MKSVCSALLCIAVPFAAAAQTKAGDFELKPLPAQQRNVPRMRAVARATQLATVRPCEENICNTSRPSACVEVAYPETAWRTCISNQGRRGLVLGPADLRRSHDAPWMRVIREASPVDIFVPYHALNLRLYDMQTSDARWVREVTTEDAGPHGRLVTLSGQNAPQVVAETNDRGIAWLCKDSRSIVRRGQELILWGVMDAANYDFIFEYRLRDDGSLGFRVGATGYNNPYFPPRSTTEAHMHDILWRIDVDLNGAGGDSAVVHTHREGETAPVLVATDVEEPFNGGREGVAEWDPKRFMTIGVEDESTNAYGHKIGYVLKVSTDGLARHYGSQAGLAREERFTLSDFAVTTYKQLERDAMTDSGQLRYLDPDQYLLGKPPFNGFGVSDNEVVQNSDIVLWYHSATHHDPHDEDHAPGDPANLMTGITSVHWTGVDMEPHNLFDFNPLGGPSRTQCQ